MKVSPNSVNETTPNKQASSIFTNSNMCTPLAECRKNTRSMTSLQTTTPIKNPQITTSTILIGGCPDKLLEAEERRASL